MKNQYFGDINDYRKYGLLRALQSGGDLRLLVAWMLTEDDGSTDGDFRSYLQQLKRWQPYDPELLTGLSRLLQTGVPRQVSLIAGSSLLPNTSYYSALVPDARNDRRCWLEGLLLAAKGMDLVFLDPDNGIEVKSKAVGQRGSSKHVAWEEIDAVWDAGCSLLIYQHFPRESRRSFIERLGSELQGRTGAAFTEAFKTPHVLFLLAAQERHESTFRTAIEAKLPVWADQIDVVGLANKESRGRPFASENTGNIGSQNPFGLHTITPCLVVEDVAGLIRFLQRVFDGALRGDPLFREDGSIQHAEVIIGDSVVMMCEPMDEASPMPAMLYLYVGDCDATYRKALATGATSVREPAIYPHGDRYGSVKDPYGNIWWVVTHVGRQA